MFDIDEVIEAIKEVSAEGGFAKSTTTKAISRARQYLRSGKDFVAADYNDLIVKGTGRTQIEILQRAQARLRKEAYRGEFSFYSISLRFSPQEYEQLRLLAGRENKRLEEYVYWAIFKPFLQQQKIG